MLTLLSSKSIIGYYIGHEEGIFALQAYAMCTRIVTVYAQSTMRACAVYTSKTTCTAVLQTTVAAVSIFANQTGRDAPFQVE